MSEDFAAINAYQTSDEFKQRQEEQAAAQDQRLTDKLTDAQQRAIIVPKLKERSLELGYLTTEPAGVPLEHIEALVPNQRNEDYVADDIVLRRGIANAEVPSDGELMMNKPADDTDGMANTITTEEHMTIVNKIVKLPTSTKVRETQFTVTDPVTGQQQLLPATGLNRYLREDNQLTQRQLEITSGLHDDSLFDALDLEPEFETPEQTSGVEEETEPEPETPKKYDNFPEEVKIEVPRNSKLGDEATPDDIYYFDALIAAENTKKVTITGNIDNVINFPGKWPNAVPKSAKYEVQRIVLGADLELPTVSYYTQDPTVPVDPLLEAACEIAYTTYAIVAKTILWEGDGLKIKFKLDDWCSGLGYYKEYTGKADGKTYKLMLDITYSREFETGRFSKDIYYGYTGRATIAGLRGLANTNPAYWYLVEKQANNNYQVRYRARCYPPTILQDKFVGESFTDSTAYDGWEARTVVSNAVPRVGWERSETRPVVNFSESFPYSQMEYRHSVGGFDRDYSRMIFPGRRFSLTDDAYVKLTDCTVLVTAGMSPIEPCFVGQRYGNYLRYIGYRGAPPGWWADPAEWLHQRFYGQVEYKPSVLFYDSARDVITGPVTGGSYQNGAFWNWHPTKMWMPVGMLTANDHYENYAALGATMMRAENGVIADRTKGEWLYTGFGGSHSSKNRAAHRYCTEWSGKVYIPSCWYQQWYAPGSDGYDYTKTLFEFYGFFQ